MIHRRRFVIESLSAVAAAGAAVVSFAEEPPGSLNPAPAITVANLEQTLKNGLKARRPIEFDFIKLVVDMVKDEQISLELVQSTFLWARRKQPVPYPYFERGLRERASKQGIALPAGSGV